MDTVINHNLTWLHEMIHDPKKCVIIIIIIILKNDENVVIIF